MVEAPGIQNASVHQALAALDVTFLVTRSGVRKISSDRVEELFDKRHFALPLFVIAMQQLYVFMY
jgi:hypothetical protein